VYDQALNSPDCRKTWFTFANRQGNRQVNAGLYFHQGHERLNENAVFGGHSSLEKQSHTLGVGVLVALMVLSVWFFSSCGQGKRGASRGAGDAPEIVVTPADEGGLKALLQRNNGQVIVLNFWATWCEPCREEFPDLLKLRENYRSMGLDLILLSMDDAEQGQEVKKFLREKGVQFESYIRSKGDFEEFVNSIDPNWIGGIPATFVFDRRGNRVRSLFGPQKYEALEGVVRPLL